MQQAISGEAYFNIPLYFSVQMYVRFCLDLPKFLHPTCAGIQRSLFSQDAFAMVPAVKNMGGKPRRAELTRGLVDSQSWSYWAAQVPGWEGIEDYENPLLSCPQCPSLTGIKLEDTIEFHTFLGCSDFECTLSVLIVQLV